MEAKLTEYSFKVDAKMARLLGEQSVSNSFAAIFELVKNSYDADANLSEVIFQGSTLDGNRFMVKQITVRDDGIGMTYEDISEKWMVIGTDIKERETFSPLYRRRVVGEKGIGRFATQKLGSLVTIITDPRDTKSRKTAYKNKRIKLQINWDDYRAGKTLDQIKHKIEMIDKPIANSSGTEIIIQNLREDWSHDDLIQVSEKLSFLMVPEEIAREIEHPFQARIITEGLSLPEIEIQSNLFKKAPQAIMAELNEQEIKYNIYEKGEKVKKEIFDNEPIPFENSIGNVKFKMYFYPQDRKSSKNNEWSRYYNKYMGADRFNHTLKVHSGIKIYKDNIRVMPYGEQGNDWLELNLRQLTKYGAMGGKINNRSVIGYVLLSRENNKDIIETTTREGLVKNNAFQDLTKFLLKVINQFETYRGKREELRRESATTKNQANVTKSHLNDMKDTISTMPLNKKQYQILENHVSKIEKDIEKRESEYNEEIEEYMNSEQIYRNLSTVGITTIAFSHEIINPLIGMDLILSNLRKDLAYKNLTDQERKDKILTLSKHLATILNWTNYIRAFTTLISGLRKVRRVHRIDVRNTIESVLNAYKPVLEDAQIHVNLSIPEYASTLEMNKADFESILMNLFTNSVKSLKQVKYERRIKIEANATISSFTLKFSDNGVGIHKNDWSRIFDALYTTYDDPKKGLVGTGMGLTIVKEILEEYDANIEVGRPDWNKGASFLLSIPLKSKMKK